MNEKDIQLYRQFQTDPFLFIEYMWWLRPQKKREPFIKWRNITRQQTHIVEAVQDAIKWDWPNKISIASGHGIGKSSILAMIILWFIFCYKDAQIPCTAPTQTQMYDVLRKELAKWIDKMPKPIAQLYDLQGDYLRIKERPKTWFARAKTGKKENAEALAWVHSDFVMLVVDEASWVPDEIFEASKGALTNPTILLIMISNPTRLEGYFYRSHHDLQHTFRTLQFNSEESPIVDDKFVADIIEEHGIESDQYRIRVQGKFPKEDAVDDKWFVPLLSLNDLNFTQEEPRPKKLWVDPAGEWTDKSILVDRDQFIARVRAKESVSTPKTIAEKVSTWNVLYNSEDITVDNFGVGADVPQELAYAGIKSKGINVGEKAINSDMFENRRAEIFRSLREWVMKWGQLYGTIEDWKDLLMIKFKRNLRGKIQIMSKDEMRRMYWRSPDTADAFALTFVTKDLDQRRNSKEAREKKPRRILDPITNEYKTVYL